MASNNDWLAVLSDEPSYFPIWANEFAFARVKNACCPAYLFSSFPCHAFIALFWSALPKENVKAQGLLILVIWFMKFKWSDAYY